MTLLIPPRYLLLLTLLITPFTQLTAQDTAADPRTTTALRLASADVSLFATTLNLKDRLHKLWRTKAIQDAWNTPLVQAGWNEVVKKWDEQAGPFREALKQKENQELLQLLAEMASEEVFFQCGPNTPRFFRVLGRGLGSMQSNPFNAAFGLDPAGPLGPFRELLRSLRDDKNDLVVPDVVIGFKIKDPKVAVRQVSRLEMVLAAAAMAVPEMTGKVKHQKIKGFDFGTITLDGSMVPWDQIPWDSLEGEAGEFTPLVEHLKKLKVTICVGTYDNYLVIALGESPAVIERLGEGKKLVDLPEFAPLQKHLGNPIYGISYLSKVMNSGSGFTRRDAEEITKAAKEALEETDHLKDAEKKRIARDVDELTEDIYKFLAHEPGASLAVTFGTARGEETYHYQYSVDPRTDFSKPLTLLQHTGGTPVAAFAGRSVYKPQAWDVFVKWCKKGDALFRDVFLAKLDEDDQKKALSVLEALYPLFKRFDQTTRENLIPAFADSQAGFILDNKLKSKQWHRSMPAAKDPLPILEPAIVFGISDGAKLQKGMADYRAIVNDAIKVFRETLELPIPDEVTWPAPQVQKAGDVTLYYYTFPDELQLDGRLTPTGAVGKNLAVLSVSSEHAMRVMAPRPLQTEGGPLADLNRPLGGAAYFKMPALLDAASPWIDYLLDQSDVKEHTEKHAGDIKKIIAALRIFDQFSSATYTEGSTTVTHSEWVIKDVK